MNTLKPILLLLVFAGICLAAAAQTPKKKRADAADQAFENKMYTTALKRYKKAYSREKDKEERNRILFQTAECYRIMNNQRLAEPAYRRLLGIKYEQKQPVILLHLADILRFNGRHEQAIPFYQRYIELAPDDPRGQFGLQSAGDATGIIASPTRHIVTHEKELNGRDDDFAAAYSNSAFNEIIFTSNRTGTTGKLKDEWTTRSFTDLFIAKRDVKGKWVQPINADSEGIINTEGNEGTPFFNSRFNTMYFTRCPNVSKRQNTCRIMVAKRAGKSFSEPSPLDIQADSAYTIGHPALSDDELILVFSSDMPNGQGGRDLWMATRDKKNDKFGRPRNLGETINTPGDELFPFLRYDSVLYFSSNGHPGLGGLDIYKSTLRADAEGKKFWTPPMNMGHPINSNADDFGIVFHPEAEEQGFFSSNRKGGRGGDDIYSFVVEPVIFTLQGIVKDERSLQPVPGALVELQVSDGTRHRSTTSERGMYSFNRNQIKANRVFDLSVSKEGYFSTTGRTTTVGLESSRDLVLDFIIQPIPRRPIVLPEILYDLARWDLKPQYQDSLQGLITILQKNPNITIELVAHTDARDSEERNDILSQKRAQSVVDYLILRGIDPERLTAKGFGERQPRVLTQDFLRSGYTFVAGTRLTESFIDSLPSREIKEAAHQLNRRTEFSITGTTYQPKARPAEQGAARAREVEIMTAPARNTVVYTMQTRKNRMLVPASIETYALEFIYEPNIPNCIISMEAALALLKEGIISKDDFAGNPEEILSEGQIKKGATLTLPSLRIGKKVVYDIDVTVEPKTDEKMTVNNAVLSRFGAFTINEDTREIVFD